MCYLLASREQFREALAFEGYTDIQKASRFMFLLSRSFGGRGNHFGTSYETPIKSAQGIIERIDGISKRLDKTVIENKSAFELIPQYDTDKAFFYLDPPYSTGAGYEVVSCEKFDHEGLRDILTGIAGKFLLSYDDCPKIRELYKGFNIIEVERTNGINRKNIKNNIFKELLICNYEVEKIDGTWRCVEECGKQQGLF